MFTAAKHVARYTHLLVDEYEGEDDLDRCDQTHAHELQETLELRGIVGHHVDDLSGGSLGSRRSRNPEGLAIEQRTDSRPHEHSAVRHDGLVPGLQQRHQERHDGQPGHFNPRMGVSIEVVRRLTRLEICHKIFEDHDRDERQQGRNNVVDRSDDQPPDAKSFDQRQRDAGVLVSWFLDPPALFFRRALRELGLVRQPAFFVDGSGPLALEPEGFLRHPVGPFGQILLGRNAYVIRVQDLVRTELQQRREVAQKPSRQQVRSVLEGLIPYPEVLSRLDRFLLLAAQISPLRMALARRTHLPFVGIGGFEVVICPLGICGRATPAAEIVVVQGNVYHRGATVFVFLAHPSDMLVVVLLQ